MKRCTILALLFLGAVLLLASSLAACATEPTIITHISAKPDNISLSAREGEETSGEPLEIYSSAAGEPLMWQAKDDAPWLKVSPSWDTFDSGVSKAVVFADTSGMSAGCYTATISIFVQEADNSPLTIAVELHLEPPEDPAVIAAREFWESPYYEPYWKFRAALDVLDAVNSYEFYAGTPYYSQGTPYYSQNVEIKNLEFNYNPEMYERPIAMVRCVVRFYNIFEERYMWIGNWDLVLEVEPAPYSLEHNDWRVIDYYGPETE